MMARVFVACVVAVVGDSITSCGSASDHFKIDDITLDADADGGPRKGKPFTITVSGTLDEDHTGGRVVVDAHLSALDLFVEENVTADQKYTWFPGIAAGKTQLTIGPFTYPLIAPGEVDFTGRVTLENDRAEPVLCLDIALKIPKLSEELNGESEQALCSITDNDHIANIDQTHPAVTSFDVDEVIDFVNATIDLNIKYPLLPAVHMPLQLPVTISPGLASGHHVFTAIESAAPSNGLLAYSGSVALNDKNGEQYTCITFNTSQSSISV